MISRLIAALAVLSAAASQPHRTVVTREPPPPIDRGPSGGREASRSPASYAIAVTIDPATQSLDGRERIRWRNPSLRPVDDLQFHLYYNAVADARIKVTSVRDADTGRDLLPAARVSSAAADGARARSVLRVPLARAVEPGGDLALDLRWTATLPGDAAAGGVVLATHWFPQIAVLTAAGWTVHQDPGRSYVFSDMSAFDVTIDAPDGWDVAATGHERPQPTAVRGRRFEQADASDFAFAIGRRWMERRDRVELPGREPVDVRVLLRPEHAMQSDRIDAAIRTALARADAALAPYPYADLTILDLPWRSPAAGEVFPALVTVSTRWIEPPRVTEIEASLARGLARHCWQSVVGADMVAHPWMVDGLSMFAEARLLEPLVQRQLDSTIPEGFLVARMFGDFVPYAIRSVRANRVLEGDPAVIRAARAMQTLERYVGWPTFETMMAEYARQFSFGHPTPEDFIRVAEAVSGRDLRWFFDQVFSTTGAFDYAVRQVTSEVLPGSSRYRTTVIVERAGAAVFSGSSQPPIGGYQSGRAIEIAITFADGTTRRETWDGRAESTTFVYESLAPAAAVVIDPDRALALDVRRTNNSWAREPRAKSAATRWAALWMNWLANVLLTYGALV
jgi:hypothetical protein